MNQSNLIKNQSKLNKNNSLANSNNELDKDEISSMLNNHNYLLQCVANLKIKQLEDKIKEDMPVKLSQSSQEIANKSAELDAINRRLKDIAFLAMEHRILNQQESELDKLENTFKTTNTDKVLESLLDKQNVYCDRLATKNVDFGYSEKEGFATLNAAVEESLNLLSKNNEVDSEFEQSSGIVKKLAEHKLAENNIDANVRKTVSLMQDSFMHVINSSSEQLSSLSQLDKTS